MWDREEDEWFDDAPVVICTEQVQLEFCAIKLDEFSFSLDSIDLSVPVYWCCADADPEIQPFYWVQQCNVEFTDLIGKFITGIEVVEYGGIAPDVQVFLGVDALALTGIVLKFENAQLEILNGLDCTLLSRSQHPWKGLKYTLVEDKI